MYDYTFRASIAQHANCQATHHSVSRTFFFLLCIHIFCAGYYTPYVIADIPLGYYRCYELHSSQLLTWYTFGLWKSQQHKRPKKRRSMKYCMNDTRQRQLN